MANHTLAQNLTRLNKAREDIADAIVARGGSATHTDGLESMPTSIQAIPNQYTQADNGKVVSNGALVSQTSTTATTNGTIDTTTNNEVVVAVPNTYTAGDEGKVVDNGALVAQTAYPTTITQNDTYDTTNYNSVTVNVSSGGGGNGGSDVRFIGYGGIVVQTYSAADFANLSTMPANPLHTGLTAQGWNWSLADAKTYVTYNRTLDIGQMYITSDGKTRIYITIANGSLDYNLYLNLDDDTELDVDWGDDSTHTTWTSNDEDEYKSHTYPNGGAYIISVTVVSGEIGMCQPDEPDEQNTITKVEIGSSVTFIDDYAFSECSALSSITIPNNVTYIGGNVFNECSALSSITIPNSVTSIGGNVFERCSALSSITIPNSVTSIDDYALSECSALSSITIPSSVTSILGNIFYECSALSSITIPNSVTSIGGGAFHGCSALSSITIPNSVTSIDDYAFSECSALLSITISNNVTSIGNYTFHGCSALPSINIPNSVTYIGENVFYECYALSSITFEPTTPPVLNGDLSIRTTCIIRVPQGTLSDYTSASNYPDPSDYTYVEY